MPEVLRKVLHSVIRNRNLGTLFTASYSTACVWWPNTETSSLQHPVLLRNYTDCSGTRGYKCLQTRRQSCCSWGLWLWSTCAFFRILVQICKTQAFQKLNPAQFDLHDEVSDAMQVSHHTWEIIAILMFSTSYNCKYSSHYFYIRKVQRTGSWSKRVCISRWLR